MRWLIEVDVIVVVPDNQPDTCERARDVLLDAVSWRTPISLGSRLDPVSGHITMKGGGLAESEVDAHELRARMELALLREFPDSVGSPVVETIGRPLTA